MSSVEKQWRVLPQINDDFVKKYPQYSRLVLQLLFNRGITEKGEMEEFLNPPNPLYQGGNFDPFLFNNMEAAVGLIIKHIKEGNKIVIYGDYDADGVTASAILKEVLSTLLANVTVYIPDRVSEGYGLNYEAIKEFKKSGVSLIITVDGGIRNNKEAEFAKKSGLDIIITDHHIPPEKAGDLPDCLIINPSVKGEKYPYKYLAGAGVSFKLAQAIIEKSKLAKDKKKIIEERSLDLAAIGTIADCVSLLGENRILVKKGLEVLNKTKRMGLKELLKVAQINNRIIDSWNVAFQIAPRLNAAGRMDHANTALELLLTNDKDEAASIAGQLNSRNGERQKATEELVDRIVDSYETSKEGDKIIFAVSAENEKWNEGIIGLVAGKISDKYYLPAIVVTKAEDMYKGSGRSIEEFNIIKALEECGDLLDKYGGHPSACGFSLKEKNLEKFKNKLINIANKKLGAIKLEAKIIIEAELPIDEINEIFFRMLEKFSPFGEDNPRPKFVSYGVTVAGIINMGLDGRHIKLRLKKEDSGVINAVGFGQSEQWKDLRLGEEIDIVYFIDENNFNGRRELQMKIIDIKKSEY